MQILYQFLLYFVFTVPKQQLNNRKFAIFRYPFVPKSPLSLLTEYHFQPKNISIVCPEADGIFNQSYALGEEATKVWA